MGECLAYSSLQLDSKVKFAVGGVVQVTQMTKVKQNR